MGDSHMGLHARLMSQALRKLTGSVSRSNTTLIFLNQIRMKIGVMFGNPETTTGGNALKFYASVRLEIRRIGQIKERDEVVGNQTRVKVVKNKMAPPFRQVEFDIMYGEGISKVGELIDLGVKAGVVEKSGAWFSHDSQRIGQGRENAKQFLRDHLDVADKIEHTVREQSGVVANTMMVTADEGEEAERRKRRNSRRYPPPTRQASCLASDFRVMCGHDRHQGGACEADAASRWLPHQGGRNGIRWHGFDAPTHSPTRRGAEIRLARFVAAVPRTFDDRADDQPGVSCRRYRLLRATAVHDRRPDRGTAGAG